jgi:hypothetical protein
MKIVRFDKITSIFERLNEGRLRWEKDYMKFARMRGFQTFNDWRYHVRGFILCWMEPGFHKFWQVWNPGIAYFVYRTFIHLGGRKHWVLPTIVSFILCGFAHTVIVFPFFRRWSHTVIVAFTCFGILTVVSRYLSSILRQERWPVLINTSINVGLVILGFDLGFRLDHIL